MGRKTAKSEFQAWESSLTYMQMVLQDGTIPEEAGIAIEYNIPQTSKRVDFLISGYDETDHPGVIIIELKQWSSLEKVEGHDALVTVQIGSSLRTVVHPSYQAWSYASLIADYNKTAQEQNIHLYPCAFLHNYRLKENDPLLDQRYQEYIQDSPVFTKTDVWQLRSYIKKAVTKGDRKQILYAIENGKISPSKSLQDAIGSMLEGNQEFIMIDEQKVVFERVLAAAMKCMRDEKKRTLIIEGGPGTGKSVIAINLLAELTKQGQFVQYVSKNSAPRAVYQKKLKGKMRKSTVDNLFKGPGIYTETPSNAIHTILVDEAHRLNAKSGMFQNMGENQIKEIINASICSVFFIDESQRVTTSDIGSVDEIMRWADELHSVVERMELTSQFRCNGSDGYLAWLDDVLEIRETANYTMDDINFDIQVLDSPMELKEKIFALNEINHKSRLLAGYCWNWISEGKNDSSVHDIKIGDFSMSWNLGSSIFAIDDTSINEVGCIHTSQGLEFDYVGVIIGPDMRYEDDHIITDHTKRAKTDKSMNGIKKMFKEDPVKAKKLADEIIKNTYRTLLTRGMKGCYIYCVDEGLREYLKNRLSINKTL